MVTSADALPPEAPDLTGELEVVGRVAGSSNLAVLARLVAEPAPTGLGAAPCPKVVDRADGTGSSGARRDTARRGSGESASGESGGAGSDDSTGPARYVIYKPVRGERPLWDFPDGTLAGREVAARVVSELGGWDVVPPTVLRDGPLGPGSVQLWVGDPFEPVADDLVVDLVPAGAVPPGWHSVFDGESATGAEVTVVHSGADDVRALSVLDALINNSDRKGSHCLRDAGGRLWAIDHGVSFSPEPKLRTVLWGWAGQRLREADLDRLRRFEAALDDENVVATLESLLPERDVAALAGRLHRLLAKGRHPSPNGGWPAVPWPPL